jgi:anti-sigma B factor antagonist
MDPLALTGANVNEEDVGPERLLSISTEHVGDEVLLSVAGELDMSSAPRLGSAVAQAATLDPIRRVVLDLSGTDFIDSSGLRAMLSAREQFEARGCEFTLRAPSPAVTRLLEITALADHFVIDA